MKSNLLYILYFKRVVVARCDSFYLIATTWSQIEFLALRSLDVGTGVHLF